MSEYIKDLCDTIVLRAQLPAGCHFALDEKFYNHITIKSFYSPSYNKAIVSRIFNYLT